MIPLVNDDCLSKRHYYYSSYSLYVWPVTRPAAFVLQTSMIPQNLNLRRESVWTQIYTEKGAYIYFRIVWLPKHPSNALH